MSKSTEIIFTICSANYLAQAITLGKSLQNTNPGVEFRIYLVDRLEGREEVRDKVPFKLIEIENVPVTDFEGMILRYNVVELNTSVKPYIFDHILKQESEVNKIVYFDPDIMVFQPLNQLFERLDNYNMVLTPHILSPSDNDSNVPQESSFLATGIFNLGFIAIKRSEEIFHFLNWWKEKLVHQGYARHEMHLFFDQKWMNFAPVFFDGVYVEKSKAYNMAPWNLHERKLIFIGDTYYVNETEPLVFYHFSSYKIAKPEIISGYSGYTLGMRPEMIEIFRLYHSQLLKNGGEFFKKHKYFFDKYKIQIMRKSALLNSNFIMSKLRKLKYKIQDRFV